MIAPAYPQAPPWSVSEWLNTRHDLHLESLRGRVVVLHAFQMLCPGCVSHALPQARSIHTCFPSDRVQVVGLHTVFEHHDAMAPVSLKAFAQEYRLGFPIGVDEPDPSGPIPVTMQRYGFEGTPTLVLIDRAGHIRFQHLGHVDDLKVGALIGQLLAEPDPGSGQGT